MDVMAARARLAPQRVVLPESDDDTILHAARVALDRDYVFACCGALFAHFAPEAVVALMRASAGL